MTGTDHKLNEIDEKLSMISSYAQTCTILLALILFCGCGGCFVGG